MEYIAVEGMSLKFVNPAHSGNIAIIEIPTVNPTDKAKSQGKKAYLDTLPISISNGSDGVITNATGVGTMLATTTKLSIQNLRTLRKGDQSIPIVMTGTNPAPPPPTLQYVTLVEIDDANQDKWRSN